MGALHLGRSSARRQLLAAVLAGCGFDWFATAVAADGETTPVVGASTSPAGPTLPLPAGLRPESFEPGLSAATDLLVLPAARRPPPRPTVTVATRVATSPGAVVATFLNPRALREAIPSLVKAEVVATRPGLRPDTWPDRLLDWELEIPLFNLSGRAWLRQRPGGADLELVEGAFAPGLIRVRATPSGDRRATILTCEMRVEVRATNFIFRKVAKHDPWAETAMSAATAWVIARALAARAEAPAGAPPERPRGPIQPPPLTALDASLLARPDLAPLRAHGVVAAVRRGSTGRLAWAAVAVSLPGALSGVAARLALPETWAVFPGWKQVNRRPALPTQRPTPTRDPRDQRAPTAAPITGDGDSATVLVEVEDDVSLVDLDAVWAVAPRPPGRAVVVEGSTRGAVLAWQTATDDIRPNSTLAVLTMHPRLDAAGYVERKLVAAEPLLEHALALALAYVDVAAIADSFDRPAAPRAAPGSAPVSVPAPAPDAARPPAR